ncbi:unnamed protein product [Brugia timori]|uniref:Phage protein n=1 Tax=Brugia timori TaxID=42155 RepID=A0A0R3QTB0_9BILA|nr:unnamed protein product [Brugia timori]
MTGITFLYNDGKQYKENIEMKKSESWDGYRILTLDREEVEKRRDDIEAVNEARTVLVRLSNRQQLFQDVENNRSKAGLSTAS